MSLRSRLLVLKVSKLTLFKVKIGAKIFISCACFFFLTPWLGMSFHHRNPPLSSSTVRASFILFLFGAPALHSLSWHKCSIDNALQGQAKTKNCDRCIPPRQNLYNFTTDVMFVPVYTCSPTLWCKSCCSCCFWNWTSVCLFAVFVCLQAVNSARMTECTTTVSVCVSSIVGFCRWCVCEEWWEQIAPRQSRKGHASVLTRSIAATTWLSLHTESLEA